MRMFFISHSSKDAEAAQRIVGFLEGKGIPCWIAPRNLTAGRSYPAQIVKAIRECAGFILVASENANQSNHINSEVARAFDLNKTIYPFMIDHVRFSDDFIYYLGQIQWISAGDSFEAGLETLYSVIRGQPVLPSLSSSSSPAGNGVKKAPAPNKAGSAEPGPEAEVRIATYQDLVNLGMTALDIAKRLVRNDYLLYPGLAAENEGNPEQWAGYLSAYPDTFRYLINRNNEIIGNWSFLAVSEELHAEKLSAGRLTENTFALDETEYLLPGDYVGYLLNLSLNDGYNTPRNLNMLLQAFVEQLLTFAEEEIFFKSWYVNVFRKDHEAMYRRIGFSYLLDNVSFGKVYYLSCIPPAKEPQRKTHSGNAIFNASKKLMRLYYEHFVQDA